MNWLVLLAATAAIVLPSANYQAFSGVPLSSLHGFIAVMLLVPALAFGEIRRELFLRLARHRRLRRFALGGAATVLGTKVILVASGTAAGLPGCYASPVSPPPNGRCEASYQNPWLRFGATRIDKAIAFDRATWNLSFVNSYRFNFYPPASGVRRDRIPLSASWVGVLQAPGHETTLELAYVGEGRVAVGAVQLDLSASYSGVTTVRAAVPPGRQIISLRYLFDARIHDASRDPGPYAQLDMRFLDAAGNEAPVTLSPGRPPGWKLRALAAAADTAVLIALASILGFYGALAGPGRFLLLGGLVAAPLIVGWGVREHGHVAHWLFLVVLLVALVRRRSAGLLPFAFFLGVALQCARISAGLPDPGFVAYRSAGDDWLTYESLARSVLETGSLQGGEDVFYYQPFFRYVLFAGHSLLGDGDLLVATVFSSLAAFGVLWTVVAMARGTSGYSRAGIVGVGAGLLAVVTSPAVVDLYIVGASEGPTWVLVPTALTLVFLPRTGRAWAGGAVLLALAAITRFNQLPVLALLLVASAVLAPRPHRRLVFLGAVLFCAVLLLPLAHNLYFGQQAVLTTASATIGPNLIVSPSRLASVINDPDVRQLLTRQLGFLLSTHPAALQWIQGKGVLVPFRVLQLAWVAALALALWRRSMVSLVVLFLPASFFVTHLFYQVDVYYPRHVVIGSLILGWVAAWSFRQGARCTGSSALQKQHRNQWVRAQPLLSAEWWIKRVWPAASPSHTAPR